MSDNKKYYYLKLKENFFDSDSMIVLESMQDGYKYSNILLKLYLRSLKNEGKLMLNERIPYNSQMLAQVTRHSVGDTEKALHLFSDLGLIEVMDNGAIFMSDIQNFVGRSTTEADRKREYRARIDAEGNNQPKLIGQKSDKCPDKYPPEKEIEKELEIEIEKELQQERGSGGQNVHSFYQDNFGIEPPTIMQDIEHWVADLNEELVIEALKKAVEAEKPYNYAKGIMRNWIKKGVKTMTDVEAETVKRDRNGRQVINAEVESYGGVDF